MKEEVIDHLYLLDRLWRLSHVFGSVCDAWENTARVPLGFVDGAVGSVCWLRLRRCLDRCRFGSKVVVVLVLLCYGCCCAIFGPPCVWCRCCSYSVRFRIFLGTEFPWLVQKESESIPGFVLQMRLWTWIGLEWGVKRTACTFFGLGWFWIWTKA